MMLNETKIRQLLDKYDVGESSLAEERELKSYFNSETSIPEDLKLYQLIFTGFETLKEEDESIDLSTSKPIPAKENSGFMLYKIAAVLIVALTTSIMIFNAKGLSNKEEQQALQALQQTKTILNAVSSEMNQSTAKLNYLNTLNTSTNKFFKQ